MLEGLIIIIETSCLGVPAIKLRIIGLAEDASFGVILATVTTRESGPVGINGMKQKHNLLLLIRHPWLTLLLAVVHSQLLQHHVSPIVARTISPAHLPALLLEARQGISGWSVDGVLIVFDGVSTLFQLLHLTCH